MTETTFGKAVKMRLIQIEKNQAWLIEQVRERTGLFFDSSYMRKILTGVKKTPKIMGAIREILELPEEPEEKESEHGERTS